MQPQLSRELSSLSLRLRLAVKHNHYTLEAPRDRQNLFGSVLNTKYGTCPRPKAPSVSHPFDDDARIPPTFRAPIEDVLVMPDLARGRAGKVLVQSLTRYVSRLKRHLDIVPSHRNQ